MAHASVALAQARTLLNDDLATVWTDAALLPKLQIAHQEIQSALWAVGSPVVREESYYNTGMILVDIGALNLGASQPADLLAPTKLFEWDWATGPVFTNPIEMTEVFFIPSGVAQSAKLLYWCWKEELITFLGSTAKRGISIQYRKLLTVPTLTTSELGIAFAESYIGPRVAALAAGSVGNDNVLKIATEMAATNFAKVLAVNRGQQKPSDRP